MQQSLFLLVITLLLVSASSMKGTVYYHPSTQSYSFKSDLIDQAGIATVSFQDDLDTKGWGILSIETSGKYDDAKQLYAAGYAEGATTWERIYQNYQNMYHEFFGDGKPSQDVLDFFEKQEAWVEKKIEENVGHHYWDKVGLIVAQFSGLVAGYNDNIPDQKYRLTVFDLQFLNANGDLLDLNNVFSESPDWDNLTPEQVELKVAMMGHCSAIVKVPGDLSELWSSHSSWFTYQAMNRIYKHYSFNVHMDTPSRQISFSSYPGYLSSLDDFYIMSNGLVMLQTTNNVFNHTLFKEYVHPESLWAWQRVRLACMFATDGEEWAFIFSQYNSGTYNNQYMVIDYNKFTPGEPLKDNTLWVVEQIPGLVKSGDMTSQLERGYWASYNVAYFPEIYERSGYPEFVKKHGLDYSYQMAPRAQIFRRDQGTVVDMDSLKSLMRYNNYLHDPIAQGNPGRAICSRFDLATNPSPAGCYDTKMTSYSLRKSMTAWAINGPTTSHNLPPFTWSNFNSSKYSHLGQPNTYNFDFVEITPKFPIN